MNNVFIHFLAPEELELLIFKQVKKAISENDTPTEAQQPPQKEIMSIHELSEYLGVTVPTIYGYLNKKKIPSYKKMGKVYFLRSEIDTWLRNGKRATADEITNSILNPR